MKRRSESGRNIKFSNFSTKFIPQNTNTLNIEKKLFSLDSIKIKNTHSAKIVSPLKCKLNMLEIFEIGQGHECHRDAKNCISALNFDLNLNMKYKNLKNKISSKEEKKHTRSASMKINDYTSQKAIPKLRREIDFIT